MKFSDVFEDQTKYGTKIKTDEYKEKGKHAIVDQGKKLIAGYTDLEDGLYNNVPAIIFGDHTRVIKYIDVPFFLGADGTKILKCKVENANYKYLYYALTREKIPDTGYNRHFKWLKEIDIKYPSVDKQDNIVKKLDKLSYIIQKRQQELDKLDELVKARFVEMFNCCDLAEQKEDWKPISKIGTIISGSTPKTTIAEYWDGEYRWITPAEIDNEAGYIYDSQRKITLDGAKSCSLTELPIDTVLLTSRAPIGKVALAGNTFFCNQGFKNIVCNNRINPLFLYTLLRLNTDYLNSLGRGATFKEISKKIVENIKIPVPSMDLQNQFATFVKQIDKSKVAVQKALDEAQLLFDSLMQEYFG